MPRFAANLSFMFGEWSFLDRFDAAGDAGFAAVEYLFPYDFAPDVIAARLRKNGLTQALFNLPPGDFAGGERGIAALPERFEELKAGVAQALLYAKATGAKRLHMMAGIAAPEDPVACAAYRRAIAFAAEQLAEESLELLLEPINPRDIPGYFLRDYGRALQHIEELRLPNVKLQFDVYHRQILHGDVTVALRALMPKIGHIQIASVPSRQEPDGEELNHPFLFAEIDRLGYDGLVGCEYRPRGETLAGLGWFRPYARR
ncbi:2-oxo-tetronate isomerase [Methylovirgula sp. HY1]|uniref:2-oxo-tetronate isomerase n=1 Tax=Methylovirgula sp. HY1 TaxID=2822761 RepID=UPI001C5B40F6|nr:2-oxo-tetronate isomerase [Methylovirgula sp. HY1]QXX73208.1 Hydroxypyruvate isomerase [Methylovirgula sp. HY1]